MGTLTKTIVTHFCDLCKREIDEPYQGHTRVAWQDRDVSAYVKIGVVYEVDYRPGTIICASCAAKELRTEADRIERAAEQAEVKP